VPRMLFSHRLANARNRHRLAISAPNLPRAPCRFDGPRLPQVDAQSAGDNSAAEADSQRTPQMQSMAPERYRRTEIGTPAGNKRHVRPAEDCCR
jgi:hypothetical protein